MIYRESAFKKSQGDSLVRLPHKIQDTQLTLSQTLYGLIYTKKLLFIQNINLTGHSVFYLLNLATLFLDALAFGNHCFKYL